MEIVQSRKTVINWLILFIQGVIVGVAAILPGASGGVLCVAFGIYEPIMALIAHPLRNVKRYYKMFIPFLAGCIAGFILLAGAVAWLFEKFPVAAMALFAGLICGTVPELIKKSYDSKPSQNWSSLIIPLVAVFTLLRFLQTEDINSVTPNFGWYLFCGVAWGLSIVFPGLSSSSFVIFLGLYQPMTAGIAKLDPAVLIPMLIGLLATIIIFARLVTMLFEKQYAYISKIILGMMIASTLMIVPVEFKNFTAAITAVLSFAAGFIISRKIDDSKLVNISKKEDLT